MAPAPRPAAAPPARPPRLRRWLAWAHLWLGLGAGTVFALVSLAGTVLVFHTELLRAGHPQLAGHAAVADGAVMGRLLEHWGPRGLTALDLPREALPVWQGYFADGSRAYFAPDDGRLLLQRAPDGDWLMWLHHWHVELLGGAAGKQVLGVVGWIALGLLASGLVLWWPRAGRWRGSLRWHAGPPTRRWFSWHRGSGVLLLPLLGLATLTGVGMVYSAGFRSVLVATLGAKPAPVPAPLPAQPAGTDWPRLLDTARTALPGARLSRVSPPAADAAVVGFRAQAAGEWHPVGRSLVAVDKAGQAVRLRHDATADRPGARLSNAIYPLHVAAVGGLPMKLALAATGLAPGFLLATGFLFWRRRRGRG